MSNALRRPDADDDDDLAAVEAELVDALLAVVRREARAVCPRAIDPRAIEALRAIRAVRAVDAKLAALGKEKARRAAIAAEKRALERSGRSHRAVSSLFERLSPAEVQEHLDEMLASSADDGDIEGMAFYRALGATDFGTALCRAAARGREAAMLLCCGWGARDFNAALASAARRDKVSAMHLCREWGATDFEGALRGAAEVGAIRGMALCREWGARNFLAAISDCGTGSDEADALLASWIAESAD